MGSRTLLQRRVGAALVRDPAAQVQYERLRDYVRDRLLQEISGDLLLRPSDSSLRLLARERIATILEQEGSVPAAVRDTMVTRLVQDLVGFGILQPLIDDPEVTEILVNRHDDIWVERQGRLERVDGLAFESDQAVRHLAERIAQPIRRRIDERHPILDARLADGSRVCATLSPPALDGCAIAIRKFNPRMLGWQALVENGTLTPEAVDFLRRAVRARCNLLVTGSTSSGKTTVLGALSAFIPPEERVITIEDAAELQLQQPHVLRYETRSGNAEGQGAITIRDLVRTSLRLRPDRIIVGEVRGPEALDMVQACNTGHDGSFSTLHANSAQDGLARLETMVLMADSGLPIRAIRQQIASAFELVVHCARLRSGQRRVVEIAEVGLTEDDAYRLRPLFVWNPRADRLEPTGLQPERVVRRYLWEEG
ncbi:MAG: CpaF family protein [Symbiobacterium sp.]|uniref:CpaF family protein n=1 Tax=Symbiobacterium sp. TaxID=1971213 RepID=UPI003463C053